MPSKKEEILLLLNKGKNLDDLLSLGYNKRYVQEIIKSYKKQANKTDDKKNIKEQIDENNVELNIEEKIHKIKEILSINNWNYMRNSYRNKNIKETLIDLMKISELIENDEQLSTKVSIDIKIFINENKKENKNDTINILNPIQIYREKGEELLREDLRKCDIDLLKKIARKHTPDPRGYIYRWKNTDKIIDYIVQRTIGFSDLGIVFVTEK